MNDLSPETVAAIAMRRAAMTTIDLSHDELIYLMQLVNADFCDKQRKLGNSVPDEDPTLFEVGVFRKLSAAQK